MTDEFSRSRMLLGTRSMERLKDCRIAIFGIGGVGGYAVEALTRTGVGAFVLIDNDVITLTNLNRQLIATHDTIGRPKVEVMRERILQINPNAQVVVHQAFYLPDRGMDYIDGCDYVVDAIDTVSGKIALAEECQKKGIPLISSMGAGNKLDPTQFEVADIYETSVCPLCRAMRQQLKKRDIRSLKVVYSKEPPRIQEKDPEELPPPGKHQTPGSVAFVPSVAGLILASEVIRDLTFCLWPKPE